MRVSLENVPPVDAEFLTKLAQVRRRAVFPPVGTKNERIKEVREITKQHLLREVASADTGTGLSL